MTELSIPNKQTTGLNRDTTDKYYTRDSAVSLCISLIKQHIPILKSDLIIEPSAGNGAFISHIKQLSGNCEFYDIEPDNVEIVKQDYLSLSCDQAKSKFSNIHIIGNPPFGRQSSLAIKFIKHSCSFCNTLSFILPKSFKKDSLKKSFPPLFHLVCEQDLPQKSFLVDGSEHDVPCLFQIWVKRDYERDVTQKEAPQHFTFVDKDDNPDISFRRVGVNAGKIDVNSENKSIQSHYFIKFTNGSTTIEANLIKLQNIHFAHENTVGPKSISKPELIAQFNSVLSIF